MTVNPIYDSLIVAGILVVVAVVIAMVIKAIVYLLGRVRDGQPSDAAPIPAPHTTSGAGTTSGASARPGSSATPASGGIPAGHLAAIAAACAVMLDGHRVVHIEPRRTDSWVAQGRAAQHDHRINPRPR